jgi:hypothetical protein
MTTTTRNSYIKAGVNDFDPYCDGWMAAIKTTGQVSNDKERLVKQYEPVAKKNARELTISKKKLFCDGIDFMDNESDLGDVPLP